MQHSYPRGSADTQLHRDRFEKFNSDSKLKTTGDDSIMQTELTDTQNSSDGPQEVTQLFLSVTHYQLISNNSGYFLA